MISTLPTSWAGGVLRVGVASESIKGTRVKMQYKNNSGLCRLDYYDWPVFMQEIKATHKPQASVVTSGGNDMQGLVENGTTLAAWSPEWTEAYGRRVSRVIEILREHSQRWTPKAS